jgi:hypothetical protein
VKEPAELQVATVFQQCKALPAGTSMQSSYVSSWRGPIFISSPHAPMQLHNGRPVVYVAQYAHGSYHGSQGPPSIAALSCSYFGEARGGGVQWDTAANATFVNLMVSSAW